MFKPLPITELELDDGVYPVHIRQSKRAKYLRLKIEPNIGIVVIQPIRASIRDTNNFINNHLPWLIKHRKAIDNSTSVTLPKHFYLPEKPQALVIQYITEDKQSWDFDRQCLSITGADESAQKSACIDALKALSQYHLVDYTQSLSHQFGFKINRVTIRHQKKRWGSCSAQGNINLNCEILLLPSHLIRHIVLHELCHTRELNHSQRFWHELNRVDADYAAHNNAIKKYVISLP